jgi:hypothetical protein|nr:MAG TPA: hypothetical protein [Caudoviricetes sp.]
MLERKKTLCNGKIVIVNFKKLKPQDFEPIHHLDAKSIKEELALCSADGRIYINSKQRWCKLVSSLFEILMKETRQVLQEYQEFISKKYPNIKTFDDFILWSEQNEDGEARMQVFTLLAIPIELQRRKIEQAYNGKIVDFPV